MTNKGICNYRYFKDEDYYICVSAMVMIPIEQLIPATSYNINARKIGRLMDIQDNFDVRRTPTDICIATKMKECEKSFYCDKTFREKITLSYSTLQKLYEQHQDEVKKNIVEVSKVKEE